MDRSELVELHYIVPLENLPSILADGILSNQRASAIAHSSVAMAAVQSTRSTTKLPNGRALHSYANLYFNGRNTMMFLRKDLHATIGVVSVSTDVLDMDGVVVTDCNAAAVGWTEFGSADEVLPTLSHDEIFARSWNHADYYAKRRHKARMCAEVLVPDFVPAEMIRGIHLSGDSAVAVVAASGCNIATKINPYLFFRGEPL